MSKEIIIHLTAIVFIGILAQWLAWRIYMPSILALLIAGFILGPVTGFLSPDKLFGEILFPVVSLAVSIILFEGGLSLRLGELKKIGKVLRNLLSIGVLLTWAISSVGAYYLLDFSLYLSILLGAMLTVTGPTVIVPLLRHIKLTGQTGSILKWEGIVVDPIGATISVLVFETLYISSGGNSIAGTAFLGIVKTILMGGGIGFLGAFLLIQFLSRNWIPDFLHNPVVVVTVLSVFSLSNLVQNESGLLAVTVMGFALANQKKYPVKHIIEFKENLRVLLISGLFVLLAARIRVSTLEQLDLFRGGLYLALLIFVARPASVFLSTIGSSLNWRERLFLSAMAPRGIVAAAVSSIFALELVMAGYEEARLLISIVFFVIIGTVSFYGLTARPIARLLGLAQPDPQGVLIVGAHYWARTLAKILKEKGFRVLMVDTNPYNVRAARMMEIPVHNGNILDESDLKDLDLDGIGRLVALTSNDEVNSLAAIRFIQIFGRSQVYQISPFSDSGITRDRDTVPMELRGRCLFDRSMTYSRITKYFAGGAEIRATTITSEFDHKRYQEHYDDQAAPLFLIEGKHLYIYSDDRRFIPRAGQVLVSMIRKGEK